MARYNFERFSNHMPKAVGFNSLREPISEAYFPKMDSLVASRSWPARSANTKLSDLDRQLDQIQMDVSELESWSARFVEACNADSVLDVRLRLPIPNELLQNNMFAITNI